MFEPSSTTDVIGYQLYINEANSNAVPSILVYDGQAIPNQLEVTVQDLISGQNYWLASRVLNRAGWSSLSPVLKLTTGRLPMPPFRTPTQISVAPSEIVFGWESTADIGGASKLDGYKLYVDGQLIDSVSPSTLHYSYAGIEAGRSYKVSISAFTNIGEGPKSNPLTIWAVSVPSAPAI